VRVVFFGTPEFAVPSLRALVGEGFDVASVVTRPDKPTGRHRSRVTPSAVKTAALAEELPVLQPERPSHPEFVEALRALAPDLSIVAAYGHILSQALLDVPRLGSFNVHASLLPALRGAAPIQRAILAGCAETGITIMKMDAGMDTGPILYQVATPIAPDETGGELSVRLAELGAEALIEALTLVEEAGLEPKPQDHSKATSAPKITREEEQIDWTCPGDVVARKIRAFDPAPGAWTSCRGAVLKLFGARAAEGAGGRGGEPGRVVAAGDDLLVACASQAVAVSEVQPAGRARMTARAFVNGRGIAVGDVLA
jgi:methionyl-tRNA formyltransferase